MKLLSKLGEDGWNIAFRQTSTGTILEDRKTPFSLIPNTYRSWAADPFVFIHEGTPYIFAELFDYLARKGSIGYTYYVNGRWSKWTTVIDEPFHMSYPNVFSHNGQIYMVPETSADRTLRLYRAVSFPQDWRLEKTIAKDVAWVDTTFFDSPNGLCAITTDVSQFDSQKNILLHFDGQLSLLSQMVIPEEQTALSRSAGNFFSIDQVTYRVTQDCRGHYGNALIFTVFSSDSLTESGLSKPLLRLEPEALPVRTVKDWSGLHTYNSAVNIEVVDLERRHYNLLSFIGRIMWKIKTYLLRR